MQESSQRQSESGTRRTRPAGTPGRPDQPTLWRRDPPTSVVEPPHRLACADNLDFLSSIRDEQCKLVVTSPPYNLGKEYDPIRVPSKYPNKRYFRGPRAGELSCNPKGKNPSDVWAFPNVKNNHPEKTVHPCQFPVELAERLVLSMTDAGDTVLDPYMGVGSTALATMKHDRIAYGCDVVREYVDIAVGRVRQLRIGALKTRPMNRPIYDPSQPHSGQH